MRLHNARSSLDYGPGAPQLGSCSAWPEPVVGGTEDRDELLVRLVHAHAAPGLESDVNFR